MRRPSARRAIVALFPFLALSLGAAGTGEAGHEAPFYPSFYPQEIRMEAADPASAAAALAEGRLHAYVGGEAFAGGPPPDVGLVESLAAYVVVSFDPARPAPGSVGRSEARPAAGSREARCAAARRIAGALSPAAAGGYRPHPYPVTPFHADYLFHADLAAAAGRQVREAASAEAAAPPLRLAATGRLAESLIPADWRAGTGGPGASPGGAPAAAAADATVEVVELDALLAPHRLHLNGWLGPPWLKAGWFHAYLLLAGAVTDRAARERADALVRRLTAGGWGSPIERANLERSLVAALTRGCERVVVGYVVRREAFGTAYSGGIENVGYDAQAGLGSAIFVRTAKLKDFPWNGWLKIGLAGRPAAAWNPIGGFTDLAGGLVWSAVGDPALFPEPYGGGWVPNRVVPAAAGGTGAVPVPADALRPEPGTGRLEPVGGGMRAGAKIVYRILASLFHDGTRATLADLLYAYALAFRWGAVPPGGGDPADRHVAVATAPLREGLAAVRPLRVEEEVRDLGDVKLTYEVPVVEVYLARPASDLEEAAALAPPWSTVPWHVAALAEAAVERGIAAFSAPEAARRGVPWLDLARDQRVKTELAALVDRFAREGYVPPALARLVTPDEVKARWAALRRFYRQHGHFLVANGPYVLDRWSPDGAVLQVFRDLKYPLGVGTFDRYALPRRAFVAKAELKGERLEITAEAERLFRFQRSYELIREPFGSGPPDGAAGDTLVCRYVVVGPDGEVVETGTASGPDGPRFSIDLRRVPAGSGRSAVVGLYLNGNAAGADVAVIPLAPGGPA